MHLSLFFDLPGSSDEGKIIEDAQASGAIRGIGLSRFPNLARRGTKMHASVSWFCWRIQSTRVETASTVSEALKLAETEPFWSFHF